MGKNSPGLKDVQASLWWAPVACQLLPSLPLDQLIIQNKGLLLSQQLQRFLVLLSQVLELKNKQSKTTDQTGHIQKRINRLILFDLAQKHASLTSRYFCSVLASLVSHASTVALLLRRAGSRS